MSHITAQFSRIIVFVIVLNSSIEINVPSTLISRTRSNSLKRIEGTLNIYKMSKLKDEQKTQHLYHNEIQQMMFVFGEVQVSS